MTATAETPVDLGPCGWCGCAQWDHRQGKKGCKDPDCGCGKYEPPKVAPAAVLEVGPDSPVPGVLVDGPDGPDLGVCVGGFEPAQPGDVDLPVEPEHFAYGDGTCAPDCPGCETEPVDEPVADPAPVVADPAAQAEHTEQVAAIDAQLAEPASSAAVTIDARFVSPIVHSPAAPQPLVDPAAELATARREANEALNRAGHYRAKRDDERRRADRLDAALRDATAELEQVRADKMRLAGQLAPRLADLDQALSEVSKLRHTNVELGRARAENDQLRRERDTAQTALRKTAEAYVHTSIAAATNVLFRYDADQCTTEGCGSRHTVPVEHPHPLTPVTVLIVRREVPGAQ